MDDKALLPIAELIHEALEQLGWEGDAHTLAERVKRLDLGLPAEDEFTVLLGWLGKCLLVHKMDEFQSPPESKAQYQVPDLLAVFEHHGNRIVVLIEVKTKNNSALSWRPQYYEALRNYGALLGVPVLVAWKHYSHWVLFDLGHFERPHQNYKISFEAAAKQNLMGVLAGDWLFALKAGVGFHLLLRKEEKLSEEEDAGVLHQKWRVIVEDAYFTNGKGQRLTRIAPGLWHLFLSTPPEDVEEFREDTIQQSFVIPEEGAMQWAYRALVVLLHDLKADDYPVRWREVLRTRSVPTTAPMLRKAAEEGLRTGFVKYILDVIPQSVPSFLRQISDQ